MLVLKFFAELRDGLYLILSLELIQSLLASGRQLEDVVTKEATNRVGEIFMKC